MDNSISYAVLFLSLASLVGAMAYCIRHTKACDICGFYYIARTPRVASSNEIIPSSNNNTNSAMVPSRSANRTGAVAILA
jgi:hypothetical protein